MLYVMLLRTLRRRLNDESLSHLSGVYASYCVVTAVHNSQTVKILHGGVAINLSPGRYVRLAYHDVIDCSLSQNPVRIFQKKMIKLCFPASGKQEPTNKLS